MIDIKDLKAKFDLFGILHEEAETKDGKKIYLYDDKENYNLMIPDNVTEIQVSEFPFMGMTGSKIDKTVIVYGGKNLRVVEGLFSHIEIRAIDFTNFQTGNIINMSHMFAFSNIGELDLSHFDTSSVENVKEMFYASNAKKVDVSSFNLTTRRCGEMFLLFRTTEITLPSDFEQGAIGYLWSLLNPQFIFSMSNFPTEGFADDIRELDKTHSEEDSEKLYQRCHIRIRFKQRKM